MQRFANLCGIGFSVMALMDQDTVLTIFGDDIYGVREQLIGAWSDYHAEYPERIKELNDRTARANCVHCLAKDRLSRYVGGRDDIRVKVMNRMFVVIVQNRLIIRVKKLDRFLKSSGWRTAQVQSFKGQACFPGFPGSCNLEMGYQLDRAERAVSSIHLVCPNNDAYFWASEVNEKAVTSMFNDLFPIRAPVEQQEEEDTPELRPRKDGVVIQMPQRRDASTTDEDEKT